MNQHLRLLGLAVAHEDLNVLVPTISWAEGSWPIPPDPPADVDQATARMPVARRGPAIRFVLAGTWLPRRREAA